jgi:hypothetical protein
MSYSFVTGERIILSRGSTNEGCPRSRQKLAGLVRRSRIEGRRGTILPPSLQAAEPRFEA